MTRTIFIAIVFSLVVIGHVGELFASTSSPPMQVKLVRASGDCEPACPEWLAAYGRIDALTPAAFRAALSKFSKQQLPVVINSPGGSVRAAIEIGRLIREKQLDVIAGKTTILPCDPILEECRSLQRRGLTNAKVVDGKAWCASSCSILIAGGVRRFIGEDARIGVHAMTRYGGQIEREWLIEEPDPTSLDGKKQVKSRGFQMTGEGTPSGPEAYEPVRKFYLDMGVAVDLVDFMRSIPASKMRTHTVDQLRRFQLATEIKGPREVLFGEGPRLVVPQTLARIRRRHCFGETNRKYRRLMPCNG